MAGVRTTTAETVQEGECGGRGAHAWKIVVGIVGIAASIALTSSGWFERHRLRPMSARDKTTIEVRSAGGGGGMAMAARKRARDGAPSGSSAPCGSVTSESIRWARGAAREPLAGPLPIHAKVLVT